ncbi:hypothetical protein Chor_001579 [Crotalus horridus]
MLADCKTIPVPISRETLLEAIKFNFLCEEPHDCARALEVASFNASSCWHEQNMLGDHHAWAAVRAAFAADGIVTKGSSQRYNYYVKSYQVQFSRDGKNWKTYKSGSTNEEKIFEGNSDSYQEVSNAFIPPILARYLRVVPQSWNQRAALKVGVLGCQTLRQKNNGAEGQNNPKVFLGVTSTPTIFTTIPGIVINPEKTGPPLLVVLLAGGSLLIAATVLLLVFLCYKKRLLDTRSQPEYAEPDLVQVSPGCQLAPSTFKPAMDEGYTLPLVVNPYDVPGKQHEYTEPLPLEPEYATPFVEQPAELGRGPCRTNLGVQMLPFSERLGGSLAPLGLHKSSLQYDFPTQWLTEKLDSQAGDTSQQERSSQTDLGCLPPPPPPPPSEWIPSPGDTASFQGRHFQQRNSPYELVYHKPL